MARHRKIPMRCVNVANSVINRRKNNVTLAHPKHVGKSYSKFG